MNWKQKLSDNTPYIFAASIFAILTIFAIFNTDSDTVVKDSLTTETTLKTKVKGKSKFNVPLPTTSTTAAPTTTTTVPPTTTITHYHPPTTTQPKQTVSANNAPTGSVQEIIVAAANKYGVDANYLLSVARCESTFNPNARNGQYIGLFQFSQQTFNSFAQQAGYGGANIWDATAQANVTAWAFAHGYSSHWSCA